MGARSRTVESSATSRPFPGNHMQLHSIAADSAPHEPSSPVARLVSLPDHHALQRHG